MNRPAPGGSLFLLPPGCRRSYLMKHLLALPVEIGALLAKWLTARTLPQVFLLNVIAGVAIRVVVVNLTNHRVPRGFLHVSKLS